MVAQSIECSAHGQDVVEVILTRRNTMAQVVFLGQRFLKGGRHVTEAAHCKASFQHVIGGVEERYEMSSLFALTRVYTV